MCRCLIYAEAKKIRDLWRQWSVAWRGLQPAIYCAEDFTTKIFDLLGAELLDQLEICCIIDKCPPVKELHGIPVVALSASKSDEFDRLIIFSKALEMDIYNELCLFCDPIKVFGFYKLVDGGVK